MTYDEHGGFFDHVAPGPAPNPDGQNSPNPDDDSKREIREPLTEAEKEQLEAEKNGREYMARNR